ncbi:MAG: recombinase family protein [Rhodospirillaceae bacterium]|nr:recombinase family protein [Rhodospirillales bacterium]
MIFPPHPRIAIYARYSSDLQNPSSIDDQVALCRSLIADHIRGTDPANVLVYSDAAISGATMERPGIIGLLVAAKAGRINLIVAEGLDRLSRSLKDIAAFHETLGYHGVAIWTAHEGRITELHIGFKGTMNALFLRDMKSKVRRGQSARVAAGFAPSSRAYGYRVVRGVVDGKGRNVNGVREINEAEAAIVRRVFREYADGEKVANILARLNQEGVAAPAGGLWKANALAGSIERREGLLRNEVYIGNLTYNRMRTIRDPVTGKRQFKPNPEEEWTRTHVPELKIVDDDLWERVQARLRSRSEKTPKVSPPRILKTHNQHALTGWVKCGWCSGQKSIANQGRYLCSNNRYAGTCRNSRGTKEPVVMAATFKALHARIAEGPDFRTQFLERFAGETRRREELQERLNDIEQGIGHLLEAVERGINKDYTIRRTLALQEEARHIRLEMQADVSLALPDEAAIRVVLSRAMWAVELSRDVKRMRLMFQCVLQEIVLTPVPDQPRGETMAIKLREDGWPDFWRMIASS